MPAQAGITDNNLRQGQVMCDIGDDETICHASVSRRASLCQSVSRACRLNDTQSSHRDSHLPPTPFQVSRTCPYGKIYPAPSLGKITVSLVPFKSAALRYSVLSSSHRTRAFYAFARRSDEAEHATIGQCWAVCSLSIPSAY